jgi:hypothetical protein
MNSEIIFHGYIFTRNHEKKKAKDARKLQICARVTLGDIIKAREK